ncbi:radical SAM protein [Planomonospora algeriensis]
MGWDSPALVAEAPDTRPRIERTAVRRVHGALTCYEVRTRTALEAVPGGWAVNPYRGCAQACRYCPARRGHRRLGLDSGADFDSRIVVRTDIVRRLRAELARRWDGGPVTVGLTGDCYQPAEEVYRLMPGVVAALAEAGAAFTVRTKSPLVLRDAGALAGRRGGGGGVGGVRRRQVRRAVEPGAPSAQKRLELVAALAEHGVACGVAMAPVLPLLTDSPDQLAATVRRIAAAGAAAVEPRVLRLPPGAREWYLSWLAERHPGLVARYEELYGGGPDADDGYVRRVVGQVDRLAERYRLRSGPPPVPPGRPRPGSCPLL